MQLLSPDKVKKEKKTVAEEARVRVNALGREETELVFRVNLLRQEEQDFLVRKHEREHAPQPELLNYKTELEREVEVLESRKAAALAPIEDLRREADALMANAQQIVVSNQDHEAIIKDREQAVAERERSATSREDRNQRTMESLGRREDAVKIQEEGIKQQRKDIATRERDHANKVAVDNEAMERREAILRNEQRIVESETERQKARDKEQDERERGLKFRYQVLDQAIQEKKP